MVGENVTTAAGRNPALALLQEGLSVPSFGSHVTTEHNDWE